MTSPPPPGLPRQPPWRACLAPLVLAPGHAPSPPPGPRETPPAPSAAPRPAAPRALPAAGLGPLRPSRRRRAGALTAHHGPRSAACAGFLLPLLLLAGCAADDDPASPGATDEGEVLLSSDARECRRLAALACSLAASRVPACGPCALVERCEVDQRQADPRLAGCEQAITSMPDEQRCSEGAPRWPLLCSLVFP